MNDVNNNSIVEQGICIKCGFCCDGTLFNIATVEKGERVILPDKILERYYSTDKGEWFNLPCPYFNKKCTIYDKKKAHICSAFRCQLLNDLSKRKINKINAEEIVKNAFELRNEIFRLYKTINKSDIELSFREILVDLRKKHDPNIENNIKDLQYELLIIKCNIFEILLIKHFKTSKKLESLIMK